MRPFAIVPATPSTLLVTSGGIQCRWAMWAGTAKRNRPQPWEALRCEGSRSPSTVFCLHVVTDVQLGNNPCERRFSVLTFWRVVLCAAVQEAGNSGCALTGWTKFSSRAAV
jgi:hypothetical protein